MDSKENLEEFKSYKIDTLNEFKELLDNINAIRDNDNGCPWHKSQSHETLMPYLLEESYEFIEAFDKKDKNNMKEELGDILLQLMLHSEIEHEKKEFSIKDVIYYLNKKLKYRHPYVFQKKEKISIEEAKRRWLKLKKNNNSENKKDSLSSNLTSKLNYIEPIKGTELISAEMNKCGFTWENHNQIINKIYEELEELKEALQNKEEKFIIEEFGDIYFSLINLSICLNINNQDALNQANKKFIKRFAFIEEKLNDRIIGATRNEFKKFWELAKKNLNNLK